MTTDTRAGSSGTGHGRDRRAVHVVLPGDIDDPRRPSGGNRYDRRLCDGLRTGRQVHEIGVPGAWPRPAVADRRAMADALAQLPDGATVLVDGLVAGGVPDLLEPAAARLRLIVLVHLPLGDETGLPPAEAAELTALERRTLHAAAAVIATSEGGADRLERRYGLPGGTVHVARPGVDPAPLTEPSPAGGRLLCVAAVVPRKGQDQLVEALARVDDPPWSCVFVGALDRAPDYAAAVRARADRLPGVRFAGIRTGAELDAAYADADLLVLPSLAETYGMVVTEALARGIPVLATAVDGVPEALGARAGATASGGSRSGGAASGDGVAGDGVAGDGVAGDGVAGLLVPAGDPVALADAIRGWLTDPDLRHRWRAAARDHRATLPGWDTTIRQVSEVLDR